MAKSDSINVLGRKAAEGAAIKVSAEKRSKFGSQKNAALRSAGKAPEKVSFKEMR